MWVKSRGSSQRPCSPCVLPAVNGRSSHLFYPRKAERNTRLSLEVNKMRRGIVSCEEGRKEGRRKKGRKEGRKEERKGGRNEGGRKEEEARMSSVLVRC